MTTPPSDNPLSSYDFSLEFYPPSTSENPLDSIGVLILMILGRVVVSSLLATTRHPMADTMISLARCLSRAM